jgi:hypothetical protein
MKSSQILKQFDVHFQPVALYRGSQQLFFILTIIIQPHLSVVFWGLGQKIMQNVSVKL